MYPLLAMYVVASVALVSVHNLLITNNKLSVKVPLHKPDGLVLL